MNWLNAQNTLYAGSMIASLAICAGVVLTIAAISVEIVRSFMRRSPERLPDVLINCDGTLDNSLSIRMPNRAYFNDIIVSYSGSKCYIFYTSSRVTGDALRALRCYLGENLGKHFGWTYEFIDFASDKDGEHVLKTHDMSAAFNFTALLIGYQSIHTDEVFV